MAHVFSNPLSKEDLDYLSRNRNGEFPSRRIVASSFTEDGLIGYFDAELYLQEIVNAGNVTFPGGGGGVSLGETSITAYRGDRGKIAYDHSQLTHDKALVGLANVDNTSDANKPVSSAQQTALDLKVNITSIVDNLTSTATNVPLSAAQGKALKDLIDTINSLLLSDESDLDTLQEIVDFIEINKDDLDNLSIASIAGLQTALDAKQAILSEGAFVNGDKTKLDNIESNATADQTDSEIETAYNNQVDVVSQAEAETGTSTTIRRWTALRVRQAIAQAIISLASNIVSAIDTELGSTDWQSGGGGGGGYVSPPMIKLGKTSSAIQDVGGPNGTDVWWTWDNQIIIDTGFSHDAVTNSERIVITDAGRYDLLFIGHTMQGGSSRTSYQGIYRIDGGDTKTIGGISNYSRGSAYGNATPALMDTIVVTAGQYVEVGSRVLDTDAVYVTNTSGAEIDDDAHIFRIKKS